MARPLIIDVEAARLTLLRQRHEDDHGVVHESIRWATESNFWLCCAPGLVALGAFTNTTKPITCLACLAYRRGGL